MKIKARRRQLCVTVLLWLLTMKRVKTDGKLDILFISYLSDGTESSGYCCDSDLRLNCFAKCDPMFTLCITGADGGQPCSLYKSSTNYIDNHNSMYFGSSIQGTTNPFIIQVDKGFPSWIETIVDVYDYDDTSCDDHMDTLYKKINIEAAATQQSAMYSPYILHGRTKLKIAVRAYCDPDWYGSACEKYCRATPDLSHYTCHQHTGTKICLEGWKGDNCSEEIDECTETNHICENGGSCTNTHGGFECICLVGIEGTQCENIINQCALKPCLNGGTCDGNESDFKCACPVEWTGETCADKVNFCDSSPCNMGQCTPDLLTATRFKCDCDFAWVGDRCNQSVDIVNITLLGEINHTNRDDLTGGLKRLIAELGEIPGQVDVKLTTNTQRESNCTTTFVQLYTAVENGSFLGRDLLTGIFESNPDEIINEYLPLPLYPPREEEEVESKVTPMSPDNSWDTNQYVSAILPPVGLVLMAVLFPGAFCIRRRRSEKSDEVREDDQLGQFVINVPCNRNLNRPGFPQDASTPDGDTRLGFHQAEVVTLGTVCKETSNFQSKAEDESLDTLSSQGSSLSDNTRLGDVATPGTHGHPTSTLHQGPVSEDPTFDLLPRQGASVYVVDDRCFDEVPTLDARRHVTSLNPVTEDLTLGRVHGQDVSVSVGNHRRHGDVKTLDTRRHVTSNIQPVTEDVTINPEGLPSGSVAPDDQSCLYDFGTCGNHRHVTSYTPLGVLPWTSGSVLSQNSICDPLDRCEKEDEECTVVDDNHVEDTSDENPYVDLVVMKDRDLGALDDVVVFKE